MLARARACVRGPPVGAQLCAYLCACLALVPAGERLSKCRSASCHALRAAAVSHTGQMRRLLMRAASRMSFFPFALLATALAVGRQPLCSCTALASDGCVCQDVCVRLWSLAYSAAMTQGGCRGRSAGALCDGGTRRQHDCVVEHFLLLMRACVHHQPWGCVFNLSLLVMEQALPSESHPAAIALTL